MTMLRPICLVALLAVAPPAVAQDAPPSDGLERLQEGTRDLLRDLMEEMEPGLRDLQRRLGDLPTYHAPEVLPNGDILIRRRADPEAAPEDAPAPPRDGGNDDGIEL